MAANSNRYRSTIAHWLLAACLLFSFSFVSGLSEFSIRQAKESTQTELVDSKRSSFSKVIAFRAENPYQKWLFDSYRLGKIKALPSIHSQVLMLQAKITNDRFSHHCRPVKELLRTPPKAQKTPSIIRSLG